jgi:hypothetical protein
MIVLFGILLICGRAVKLDVRPFIAVYLVGIFYYLSFCLNTQAMEFRYYAPSFFLFFIGSLSLLCTIIARVIIGLEICFYKKLGVSRVLKTVLPV